MGLNSSIPQDSANFHREQWKLVYQPNQVQSQFLQFAQPPSNFTNQQGSKQKNVNNNGQQLAIQFREKYQIGQFLPEFGNYKLIKNIKNGMILQLHQLNFPNKNEYLSYLEKHFWRQRQQTFVKSYYLTHQHIKACCSYRQKFFVQVFVEHMQVRLSGLTDIPYPENLYIIQSCLKGFHKLFQSVGYFKVTQDLIGINRQGKIKVWFNCNLAINTPEIDQGTLFADENPQWKMVRSIIDIVQQDTDEDTQPNKSFSQYLTNKNKNISRLTFSECINQLQKYAKYLKIKIPSFFVSMLQIINDEIQDSFNNNAHIQILHKSNISSNIQLSRMKSSQQFLKAKNNNSKSNKAIQNIYVQNQLLKNGQYIPNHPNQLQPIINFYKPQQKYVHQSRKNLTGFNPQNVYQNSIKHQVKPFYENNYHQKHYQNGHSSLFTQGYDFNKHFSKPNSSQLISTNQNITKSPTNFQNIPDLQHKFGHFKPIVPYNFLASQNKNQKIIFNGNMNQKVNNNYLPSQMIKHQSMPQSVSNFSPVSVHRKSIASNIDQQRSKKNIFGSSVEASENDTVNQLNKEKKIHRRSEQELHSKSTSSLNSAFAQASNNIINPSYSKKPAEVHERKFDPRYSSQIQSKQIQNSRRRKDSSPHKSVISVSKRSQKGQLQSSIRQQSSEKNDKYTKNIYSSVIAKPELYSGPVNVYINRVNQQPNNIFKHYSQIQPSDLHKMTDSDIHFFNNSKQIQQQYILEKQRPNNFFDNSGQKNYLNLPKKLPYGLTAKQIQKYKVFSQCNNKNQSQVHLDPQILKDLARYGF